jgi:hypothetical protein
LSAFTGGEAVFFEPDSILDESPSAIFNLTFSIVPLRGCSSGAMPVCAAPFSVIDRFDLAGRKAVAQSSAR